MIEKVIIQNFKRFDKEEFAFSEFDIIAGVNNSGKSTVLQALAIWQFVVTAFSGQIRSGNTGIQVVLPNFSALPVPEFNLLWRNRQDRSYPIDEKGKKKQTYILIEIEVFWKNAEGVEASFGVQLRYQSPQSVYAIPKNGWAALKSAQKDPNFPVVAFVPPFSGLEPSEQKLDDGPVRQQVGKAQPGSVLRNMLLRVSERQDQTDWEILCTLVEKWFSLTLCKPVYRPGLDINILVEYKEKGKLFDIISGGSGFHQTLTILAFLFGSKPNTILLDEPDAHLHVRLQRDLIDELRIIARGRSIQFLTSTHSEAFLNGADPTQIISVLSGTPKRISDTSAVIAAMADVSNDEFVRTQSSPLVFYIEGQTDERILRAWADTCGCDAVLGQFLIKPLMGGNKEMMLDAAKHHYKALKTMVPDVARHQLLDRDQGDHGNFTGNDHITIWSRRHIESYLLVPSAWIRAVSKKLNLSVDDLLFSPFAKTIEGFFEEQAVLLPKSQSWKSYNPETFKSVDAKSLLFTGQDSLFRRLRILDENLILPREDIAAAMTFEEIHLDISTLFERLTSLSTEIKVSEEKGVTIMVSQGD